MPKWLLAFALYLRREAAAAEPQQLPVLPDLGGTRGQGEVIGSATDKGGVAKAAGRARRGASYVH